MVLSLGSTPPANAFLKNGEIGKPEQFFPLDLYFCKHCSFVQLLDIVSPELLFRNYVYLSSVSTSFVAHFEELAETICNRFNLSAGSLIADIGSNDGILLRPLKERGMRVVGVDPATKIAELATKSGIETIGEFFTPEIAKKIAAEKGHAKIVTATSVFPHIDNLDSFVAAVRNLLSADGIFIIEAYYLVDLLEKNLFDTIYHEHLSYFTVRTIAHLLGRLGMEVFDVEKTNTHGGSLRIFAQKAGGPYPVQLSLRRFLTDESRRNLDSTSTYIDFARRLEEGKKGLKQVLTELRASGKRVAGYGAAAKANTLLNYFGITSEILEYIVDDSPWKQGLYTPGTHIPVVSSDELRKREPDYILILAWNFANSIMNKYMHLGKFIIPVPRPIVINDVVDQDLYLIADAVSDEAAVLEGKTLLITGGSGFIGSYIVATLSFLNEHYFKKPCRVISLDNHIIGKMNNNIRDLKDENVIFMEHDVRNPIKVDEPVHYIISAAGIASPVYYQKFPIETIEGTIFGLKNSLELARQKNARSLLYFSSSEIYGDPDPNFIPTPEHYRGNVSPIGPRACYDEPKRVGETMCMAYYRVHNVPVKIVRPFNVYGPGMSPSDYRVIPTFLSRGLDGRNLPIHGSGEQTRTFCYVADAIIAFFKVLLSNRNGEVYNVGNDKEEISMKALADTIAMTIFENKINGQLIEYPNSYPQDEVRRRCPDLTKIRQDLDYRPTVDLKSGLKKTALWLSHVGQGTRTNAELD
jgi:nucleoside-diphosphate-sugar epimerase